MNEDRLATVGSESDEIFWNVVIVRARALMSAVAVGLKSRFLGAALDEERPCVGATKKGLRGGANKRIRKKGKRCRC
jgi:hypothetical protein